MRPIEERFWEKVERRGPQDCWPWKASTFRTGYGKFTVRGKAEGAHRVAYHLRKGMIAVGLQVCHRCDNRLCVNPAHLFLGTAADNMADRDRKGRNARGAHHPSAKLREHVSGVLELAAQGVSYRAIARQFGVSHSAIGQVVRRETWRDIDAAASAEAA